MSIPDDNTNNYYAIISHFIGQYDCSLATSSFADEDGKYSIGIKRPGKHIEWHSITYVLNSNQFPIEVKDYIIYNMELFV